MAIFEFFLIDIAPFSVKFHYVFIFNSPVRMHLQIKIVDEEQRRKSSLQLKYLSYYSGKIQPYSKYNET